MKTSSAIGKQMQVLWFVFCGLSFYVVLFALLYLIGGLLVSERAHAQAPGPGQGKAAEASDPLWVTVRVASLPAQITLCRDLGYDASINLAVNGDGEYGWLAFIDTDGNSATGNAAYGGAEALLSIYATDPLDLLYFLHDCQPHAVDTDQAMKAFVMDLRPDGGLYPFTTIGAAVVVDVANGTLKVPVDRALPALTGLTSAAVFHFSAWGIYQGPCRPELAACYGQRYAVDRVDPLQLGGTWQASAGDPSNDLTDCAPTEHEPDTQWCRSLDIVGVGIGAANQATATATVAIGAGFTGTWYDPGQSGHGIFVEVLPGNRLLAWWFSFDPSGGQQAWFGGVGTYDGNTATITDVVQATGGRWIPNFDPAQIVNRSWGAITLTFTDCNHGRADFNSVLGYGSGGMNLTRLTAPAGLTCP